jgi:hypothetical protein
VTRTRLAKLTLGAVLALVLTTSAVAWWTGGGAGSGGADTANVGALTIAALAPSQSLLPSGSPTGDLQIKVTNPNAFSVHVNQLALDTTQGVSGFAASGVSVATCALNFATQNSGGTGWTFGAGSTTVSLPASVTMGTTAASACQGRTFTVYMAAS